MDRRAREQAPRRGDGGRAVNLPPVIGKITGWRVELEPGVWLAPWDGDPGRTLVKASATVFPTVNEASAALDRASDFREWSAPEITPVTTLD